MKEPGNEVVVLLSSLYIELVPGPQMVVERMKILPVKSEPGETGAGDWSSSPVLRAPAPVSPGFISFLPTIGWRA